MKRGYKIQTLGNILHSALTSQMADFPNPFHSATNKPQEMDDFPASCLSLRHLRSTGNLRRPEEFQNGMVTGNTVNSCFQPNADVVETHTSTSLSFEDMLNSFKRNLHSSAVPSPMNNFQNIWNLKSSLGSGETDPLYSDAAIKFEDDSMSTCSINKAIDPSIWKKSSCDQYTQTMSYSDFAPQDNGDVTMSELSEHYSDSLSILSKSKREIRVMTIFESLCRENVEPDIDLLVAALVKEFLEDTRYILKKNYGDNDPRFKFFHERSSTEQMLGKHTNNNYYNSPHSTRSRKSGRDINQRFVGNGESKYRPRTFDNRNVNIRPIRWIGRGIGPRCYNCQLYGHIGRNCAYQGRLKTKCFDQKPRNYFGVSRGNPKLFSREPSHDRRDTRYERKNESTNRTSFPSMNSMMLALTLFSLIMPISCASNDQSNNSETSSSTFSFNESVLHLYANDFASVQANSMMPIIFAITVILFGLWWYKQYSKRCSEIIIKEAHLPFKGILITNRGNQRIVHYSRPVRCLNDYDQIINHFVLKYISEYGMIRTIASHDGMYSAKRIANYLSAMFPKNQIIAVKIETNRRFQNIERSDFSQKDKSRYGFSGRENSCSSQNPFEHNKEILPKQIKFWRTPHSYSKSSRIWNKSKYGFKQIPDNNRSYMAGRIYSMPTEPNLASFPAKRGVNSRFN